MQSTGAVPERLARPIALGGLLFFVEALLYFAYRYVVVFGREAAGTITTQAVVADTTLFTVFALHHSLFARDTIRKRITRTVGVLERSTYVWLSLRSALMIDVLELAGLRQIEPVPKDPASAADWPPIDDGGRVLSDPAERTLFKTSGPYGWVRHPIYSGWFLFVFAVPVMTMTQLVFGVTSSVYLLIAIPLEERSLRRSTAGAYEQYMKQVRWKLLPHVF